MIYLIKPFVPGHSFLFRLLKQVFWFMAAGFVQEMFVIIQASFPLSKDTLAALPQQALNFLKKKDLVLLYLVMWCLFSIGFQFSNL